MTETDRSADDMVAEADTGARNPSAVWQARLIIGTCIVWSLFQLYIASKLPGILAQSTGLGIFANIVAQARFVHLAFAIMLATLAFPLTKSAPRDRIPAYDWVLLVLGVGACLYLVIFRFQIADRPGLWSTSDIIVSATGMTVLMIAVYRSLGLPLVIIAGAFIAFAFFGGYSEWARNITNYGGASFSKALGHYWMQTEGVFGVALGVSTTMIFLFVLFGALLDRAGGGNWFIKVAIALLGALRGGPAKASVLSSMMTGMISGSSIANTVTTGTFTIPLMKRIGFPAEKAGAVEVASSTNGQLTPPVMGAAAFLMVEYVNIPYIDVVKHAFLPAVISYIALLYIVHLEEPENGPERTGEARASDQRINDPYPVFVGIYLPGPVYVCHGRHPSAPRSDHAGKRLRLGGHRRGALSDPALCGVATAGYRDGRPQRACSRRAALDADAPGRGLLRAPPSSS